MQKSHLNFILILFLITSCASSKNGVSESSMPTASSKMKAHLSHSQFGKLPDGTPIDQFVLVNRSGAEVQVINYGGIITAIKVPDREGKLADVVLGYDTFEPYIENPRCFGPIIGRFANRIAKGKFELEGTTYQLAVNKAPNAIHGGVKAFDKKVWLAEPFEKAGEVGVVMTYVSPDGEEGYPGTLTTHVTYSFNDKNELAVEYVATTDKTTIVNFTNHSYFNLGGDGAVDILNHELMINADFYTPADTTGIPLGTIAPVAGTSRDFRVSTPVGSHMQDEYKVGLGYDYNFLINRSNGISSNEPVLAARVHEPKSGRVMEVRTTEPGMQLYTANHMNNLTVGKSGHPYVRHAAYCLETQHVPDSPNHPNFPSTVLKVGETFRSKTLYVFTAQ